MPVKKQYAEASKYEEKLKRIAEKLDFKDLDYNWDRYGSWIQFSYKGNFYRFDHSVENAKNHGIKLYYGTDTFAQLVLALEDLSRLTKRGIYDFQTWIAGLKFLPPAVEIPEFFKILEFDHIPATEDEIKAQFRNLAKKCHPDNGGEEEDFIKINEAYKKAEEYISNK